MSDKRDRDPFGDRYQTAETDKTEETAKTAETSESIKERTNVNMYLPEDIVTELRLTHAELNVEWQREHGEDMPKNEVFYPALVKAGLEGKDIRDILFD